MPRLHLTNQKIVKMPEAKFILTDYIESLMGRAEYDKIEDGSISGIIPDCKGVISFGHTLKECQDELRSTLEEWILIGIKLGHALPVVGQINLE
jgi:predicted RNase H-like HicB family nuclease